jgi:squalene-associated FAD-dependent desaturase
MTLSGGRASVVVIGGGLAGISAAIGLADAGLEVALLESRPWLGGATWSFARRGLTIDNGQHVFPRCSVAYRDLLARLGVGSSVSIQDALDLTVLCPDGQARVRRSWLPAPWHLARSLAGYRLLSRSERAKVAAAALALQFVDVAAGDDRSLGEWLARHGQDERARRLFWDQLSLSALNVDSERADLYTAAEAICTVLLTRRDSADLGVPSVPLSQLHGSPAAELLRQLKVMVRLGVRASSLRPDPADGWEIGLAYGGHAAAPEGSDIRRGGVFEHGPSRIYAAGVVLAVPAWEAAILAPDSLGQDAARWAQLDPSPVMSIHVVYGSRVTRLPFAAAADSPVHWVMDKTASAGLHAGQYLAASVRAADGYLDTPVAQLRAEFLPAMERLFPAAAEASVEDFFVTRERRATIAHVPGSLRLRAAGPRLAGFALAGAWTDTGWPDTMEGAVRSGQAAAQKLIEELPARATVPVSTVPVSAVPASRPADRAGPESSEATPPDITQHASSPA